MRSTFSPTAELLRWCELVGAFSDACFSTDPDAPGLLEGMIAFGASDQEIARVRMAFRLCKGNSLGDERAAEVAVSRREEKDKLTVVTVDRSMTHDLILDRLGITTGWSELIIEYPDRVLFFGRLETCQELAEKYKESNAGPFPEKSANGSANGYWTSRCGSLVNAKDVISFINGKKVASRSS